MKDRSQKQLAAKFCASQRIVPFAEVVVRSSAALEETPIDVTDVDVLGVEFGRRGIERRIVFDCKTGKMSAVNRALWVSGLKTYVKASEAYLILKKEAPYSHRLVANELGVHIHSEVNFGRFASSLAADYDFDITYLADMDKWDSFYEIMSKYPRLADLVRYSNVTAATESNGARGLRAALGVFLKVAPELDPRNRTHLFLYCNFLSACAVFMTLSAVDMKNIFQFDMDKAAFERTLRYYVWGGKDSYVMRKNFRATMERAGASGANVEVELPDWPKFLNLFRAFLDAPDALADLPYLAKEVAFRVPGPPRAEPDARLRKLFNENNRARQFLFLINSYLVSAANLPRDMRLAYEEAVNTLNDSQHSLSLEAASLTALK